MSLQNSHQISEVKVLLKKGADGTGIKDIELTGQSLNVDTYTITLTNGDKYTFTVTNGSSIASIEKTATVGNVDTYTITLTNGETSTFTVTNGTGSTASDIDYDNSQSGASATKVQGAIDEAFADIATVDAKTQHGVVELWDNADIGNAFAGQTITISDFDKTKYDSVIVCVEQYIGESNGALWFEYDVKAFENTTLNATAQTFTMYTSSFNLQLYRRTFAIYFDGNDLKLAFADAIRYQSTGSTPSSMTDNNFEIPVKILGLIHNS